MFYDIVIKRNGGKFMSNKKSNAKQKYLSEKQRLEKKKMLTQMQKELKQLEMEIKYSKFTNLKYSLIKNTKISLRFMQRLAPYVLTAGIMAGGSKLVGAGFPFYSGDTVKINSNIMKEFDNLGNIRYEQSYDDFEDDSNNLYYYSQWGGGHINNGLYSRIVETYELKEFTEEELLELLNKEDLKLSDIFGEPVSKKTEYKNNITEEELNQKDYIKVVLYEEDENDYIIRTETADKNLVVTILYFIFTFLAELVPFFVRSEISTFDFDDCVREIKRKYSRVDIEELTKKLEIKQNNYDRLTSK